MGNSSTPINTKLVVGLVVGSLVLIGIVLGVLASQGYLSKTKAAKATSDPNCEALDSFSYVFTFNGLSSFYGKSLSGTSSLDRMVLLQAQSLYGPDAEETVVVMNRNENTFSVAEVNSLSLSSDFYIRFVTISHSGMTFVAAIQHNTVGQAGYLIYTVDNGSTLFPTLNQIGPPSNVESNINTPFAAVFDESNPMVFFVGWADVQGSIGSVVVQYDQGIAVQSYAQSTLTANPTAGVTVAQRNNLLALVDPTELNPSSSALRLHTKNGTTYSIFQTIDPLDSVAANWGTSLAITADTLNLFVGSPQQTEPENGVIHSGAVYQYRRISENTKFSVAPIRVLYSDNPSVDQYFGWNIQCFQSTHVFVAGRYASATVKAIEVLHIDGAALIFDQNLPGPLTGTSNFPFGGAFGAEGFVVQQEVENGQTRLVIPQYANSISNQAQIYLITADCSA